jgi:hypothetical protein
MVAHLLKNLEGGKNPFSRVCQNFKLEKGLKPDGNAKARLEVAHIKIRNIYFERQHCNEVTPKSKPYIQAAKDLADEQLENSHHSFSQ